MKIHEYQAKAILAKLRCPCAARRSRVQRSKKRKPRPSRLGGSVVVKAQIHAGGRGKGGGVKLAKDADEAAEVAEQDSRHDAGHAPDRAGRAHRAAGAGRRDAADRASFISASCSTALQGKIVFMASSEGGMDIEEVAAKTPEMILKETIEPGSD